LKKIAIALALVLGMVSTTFAHDVLLAKNDSEGSLVIVNQTGEDLNEMLISRSSEESEWEDANLFEGRILENKKSAELPLSFFEQSGNYDLTFTSVDGNDYYIWEVDVRNAGTIIVTRDDLDTGDDS
jgi:hypothetical protein